MRSFIILCLALSALCTQKVLEETYQEVKAKASWESYELNENPFKDFSLDQIKSLFGTTLRFDEHNIATLIDEDDHSESHRFLNVRRKYNMIEYITSIVRSNPSMDRSFELLEMMK